jgi:hypothetical protein
MTTPSLHLHLASLLSHLVTSPGSPKSASQRPCLNSRSILTRNSTSRPVSAIGAGNGCDGTPRGLDRGCCVARPKNHHTSVEYQAEYLRSAPPRLDPGTPWAVRCESCRPQTHPDPPRPGIVSIGQSALPLRSTLTFTDNPRADTSPRSTSPLSSSRTDSTIPSTSSWKYGLPPAGPSLPLTRPSGKSTSRPRRARHSVPAGRIIGSRLLCTSRKTGKGMSVYNLNLIVRERPWCTPPTAILSTVRGYGLCLIAPRPLPLTVTRADRRMGHGASSRVHHPAHCP